MTIIVEMLTVMITLIVDVADNVSRDVVVVVDVFLGDVVSGDSQYCCCG